MNFAQQLLNLGHVVAHAPKKAPPRLATPTKATINKYLRAIRAGSYNTTASLTKEVGVDISAGRRQLRALEQHGYVAKVGNLWGETHGT